MLNAQGTILQLYHGNNIWPFDEMIMMFFLVLDLQAWGFFVVLSHCYKSSQADVLIHS